MPKPLTISCKNCRNLVRGKCTVDYGGLSTRLINQALLGAGVYTYRPVSIPFEIERILLPPICGQFDRKERFLFSLKPKKAAPDFWQLVNGRFTDGQENRQD